MKTKSIITVLILISTIIGCLIGCSNNTRASNSYNESQCVYKDDYNDHRCQVYIIKVRGHEYLISYTGSSYGGTCIIHAAHCPCKQTK